jgi:hypothetical protein
MWVRPGAYPSGATFSISPLGKALGLTHKNDIRKILTGTNTLTYYGTDLITSVKSLIVATPGANVIKLFEAVIYRFSE